MADNPITTPLPADLPTDWVYGQTIGPQGTDVGLTQQHGYNYLMQQVNAAQQAATQIGEAFSGLPSLGSDGKIPASQLPAMNYDTAGSAAAVQANLNAHTGNKSNPHGVTAAQVRALPVDPNLTSDTTDLNSLLSPGIYMAVYNTGVNQTPFHTPYGEAQSGYSTVTHYDVIVFGMSTRLSQLCISTFSHNRGYWWRTRHDSGWSAWTKIANLAGNGILPVEQGGTGVPTLAQLAQSLFPTQISSLPDTSYNFAITGPGWSGNGYMSFQALMSQITANGGCRIASGSYVGNGLFGESNPTVLQFPFKPKYVTIPTSVDTSDDGFLELISVYNAAGNPILAVDSVPTGSEYSPGDNRISGPLGYYTCYRYDNNTNTLYFYSEYSGGAGHQKNAAGVTYYWIAIG